MAIFSGFGETLIEELSSSSLLEPSKKKPKLEIDKEDSFSSISDEDSSEEGLIEGSMYIDMDGPTCCVCKRYVSHAMYFALIIKTRDWNDRSCP